MARSAEAMGQFWTNLRTESLLYRPRTGQLRLLSPAPGARRHTRPVDGIRLATPPFHSPKFGYMMVDAAVLEQEAAPQSYVMRHPHRRQLDREFASMRVLVKARGFSVTVVTIPSAPRL